MLAGAVTGIGAFLFASNFSDFGIYGLGIAGPAGIVFCILIRIFKDIVFRMRKGVWTNKNNSRIYTPEGKFRFISVVPLMGSTLTNVGYLLALAVGWKLAKACGLNQGIISSLILLACLLNVVVFYFKFGEKISGPQYIGIVFSIASVVLISVAAS